MTLDNHFLHENMMGPNAWRIAEELTKNLSLEPGMRVLDLGCGRGLTSVFLAQTFGVEVFAVDLWTSATENLFRFRQAGVSHLTVPLQFDAMQLPFADAFFDAVVSVDAYHYFGNNDEYFKNVLKPVIKPDGIVAIAFPGMKYEVQENLPEEMKPFWDPEAGYLADYVDNSGRNMDVRPNQLYAVSLDYSPVDDEVKSAVVMTVNNELVTTRGIRTLSPRNNKYRGVYEGSQIDRDLAYHQGCAFPSLLGPYMNICFKMMGPNFYKKAEYLTEGFYADINKHGVGAFSELYDGDPPHEAHGAISSACSTAALLRVYYLMNKNRKEGKK